MKTNLSVCSRHLARGFTLIELMIVVAIVGILAAVAYPSYTDYIRRGSLSDAFSGLSGAQVKMEQYYQDNRSYMTAGNTCGFIPTATKYFTFTCPTITASTYVIRASGVTGTAAAGHVYTVNESNLKVTEWFKGAAVSTAPGTTCWLTKSTSEC